MLFVIRNICHNISGLALEDFAKYGDGVGTDTLIPLQTGDLSGTDVVFSDQGILGDALFFHNDPQVVVRNQGYHPPLLLDIITEYGI